jgi:hypothetical protein
MNLWKDCKLVHGLSHHLQSQASMERANADIESMEMQWMDDENTKHHELVMGHSIHIAHKKNKPYNEGIEQIPY